MGKRVISANICQTKENREKNLVLCYVPETVLRKFFAQFVYDYILNLQASQYPVLVVTWNNLLTLRGGK